MMKLKKFTTIATPINYQLTLKNELYDYRFKTEKDW